MPFRWQGKYLLLTYPLSDFPLDEFLSFLRSPGVGERAVFIRVCHELHQSGDSHRHALLVFDKRFSFTSERRFDFRDRHPNIRGRIDSPADALDYVSKDNNYLDYGICPDFESNKKESRNELWGRLLDEATSPSDFLSRVRAASPYDFATRYTALEAMARAVFRPDTSYASEHDPEDFDLPDTIQGWLEKEFDQEVRIPLKTLTRL